MVIYCKFFKVQDFVSAIAWKSGTPFGIVAESTIEKVAELIEAFIDGYLFMDDMLEIQEITSAYLHFIMSMAFYTLELIL